MKFKDLSTTVPSFPGVTVGIAGAFKKGPVLDFMQVTSEADFLRKMTPNNKIDVGMDNVHFSVLAALYRSNDVRLVRPDNGALYGGVVIQDSTGTNAAVSTGMSNPESYSFASKDALLLYGANPGEWNNRTAIKLFTYEQSPDYVKEDGAFVIDVYEYSLGYGGVAVYTSTGESWTVSRDSTKRDGYNRAIYVVDILSGSEYIRATDNLAVAAATELKEQTTYLRFEQGDDGDAVTDGEMIIAIDKFANRDDILVTLLGDGGWAVPSVQLEIASICTAREDCFACMSTPYANEASSSYMTELVDYRKTDLNVECSYAALYTPHVKVYDKWNDRAVYVPPDGYALAAMAYTASNYGWHYPPAGYARGKVVTNDLRRRFSETERDSLYDVGINPFRFAAGKGIYIWGQKTLYTRPSAQRSINVMTNLMVVRPAVKEALEDFLFENNDEKTIARVKRILTSAFNKYVAEGQFKKVTIRCDSTNNTAYDSDMLRLNVDIFVIPVKAIEEINYTTILVSDSLGLQVATTVA